MVTIADCVREILPEAIERVSAGGKMKFDIRSLYYAVRELFLKRWPDMKFYEYNSFTQDFMRSYEKAEGKVKGMVRGPRGKYAAPDEYGFRSEDDVKPDLYLMRGCGNKIIVVEKLGLYEQMKENDFDKRLDCIIMTTQGFTSEAGREALLEVERWGLPVCVLHDYDVNGVLIKETLTKPTKRLDTAVNPDILVDVGLSWEVVNRLMDVRGLTPEPVSLARQDSSKLEGMLERGEITEDEHEFLTTSRVELNALTPLELLEWLEDRLEKLDLWKTVPTDEELQRRLKGEFIAKLASNMMDTVKEGVGYDVVYDLLSRVEQRIRDRVEKELEGEELPETWGVEEFKEKMRQNMTQFWTRVAASLAAKMTDNVDTESKAEDVADKLEEIREHLEQIEKLLNDIVGD